jgi:4-amino-4-deoxy-L-arabinose transferase-like glycosyltransferase
MTKIKKEYFILFLILLIGFILRVIKFGDIVVGTDVAAFARLGKNFIESGSYTFGENYNMGVFFPPGYPLFIGTINPFVHDLFFSARLVSLIASLITIFLFYLIGRELHNDESGLFAAFAYAVYPLSIILGVYGNSDALFFCFFFLAIYLFLLSLKKDSVLFYLLLGFSAGISTITRPEGMFIFILPFLHFLGFFGEKPLSARRHIIKIIVMLSVFIMIISPYMLFVKNYTGKLSLSGKNNIAVLLAELSHDKEYHEIVNAPNNLYDKAAFSLTSDKRQLNGWNRNVERSLLKDLILKDPLKFMSGYINKVSQEIKILVKLFLPFMIPLMFLLLDRDLCKRRTGLIFVLFPIIYFFMYPIFIIIERQTFLIVLFPLILSSIGFVNSRSALAHLSDFYGCEKNRVAIYLEKRIKHIIIIIFVFSSFTYLKWSSFDKVPEPIEHARAGSFIKNTISNEYEKINVMSAKPIVSFFSDAKFTMLPYANGRDVAEFAKLYNVDIIAVDERLMSQWDFYDELVHLDRHSDDVQLIYEDTSDKMMKLFKIKR